MTDELELEVGKEKQEGSERGRHLVMRGLVPEAPRCHSSNGTGQGRVWRAGQSARGADPGLFCSGRTVSTRIWGSRESAPRLHRLS